MVFPLDYIDASGWWHTVRFSNPGYCESVQALSEWLTGSSLSCSQILSHKENRYIRGPLKRGDRILTPYPLLLPAMKMYKAPPPLPDPPVEPPTPKKEIEDRPRQDEDTTTTPGVAFPFINGNIEGLLKYHGTMKDGYAEYQLLEGESLYSAVVVRFTDYSDNVSILTACDTIAKCSGIKDVHCIPPGQTVIIPMEMLAARFQPRSSEQRIAYEAVREEEQRLRQDRVHTKDLEGVVIILDPGHGGRDHGAAIETIGLYEDEINYDIVCRIKALLETQTNAKVHITTLDPKQQYTSTNVTRFAHDTCEHIKTSPTYNLYDNNASITLRWSMANSIYHQEIEKGTDPRKIVFASIHCDYLYNQTLRGAMVYVPGTAYRSDKDISGSSTYKRYKEVSPNSASKSTGEERKRDEALSRVFASTLLASMRTNDPPLKVHDAGDPIRNVIRRSKTETFLPGVLRFNNIPTKVLVEVANMRNPQDQQRLSDPRWRQWFAEAFVNALRTHYNH